MTANYKKFKHNQTMDILVRVKLYTNFFYSPCTLASIKSICYQ